MSKPEITLESSKEVVSAMAARIYSAHIVRGDVKEGEETKWMERSIREAVKIAKTVEASIDTDDTLPSPESSPHSGTETPASGASAPSEPQGTASPSAGSYSPNSELNAAIEEARSEEDISTRGR